MEILILLGLAMMMLRKNGSAGMQTVADIMPQVMPQEPVSELPTGTIRGERGEGIRIQSEGRIVASLGSVRSTNSRSAGSMKFRMRIINFSDDWFRFRYRNLGKAFAEHFELVIISPFMQQGNTPDWFKAVIAEGISKVNSDVSKVFRLIDSKIPNPTPQELSVDAVLSGSIPIIRYLKSRETDTSPGIVTQLIVPDVPQDQDFDWDFRNDLGEKISSGVYMAMAFVRGVDQTFSTGWMKFIV